MSKWPIKTLGEIGQIVAGGTPSTNEPAFWNGKIPWITPADLSGYKQKYIGHGEKFISEKGLAESSAKLMPAGAVLFSSRAPIGYVAIAQNPVCTNQGFKSVVPNKEVVDSEYLYHYLKFAKHLADDLASGTTFKEISGKNFAKISVPIPSITKQRQVVSKINALFSDIDAGTLELEQSVTKLDLYKQSVLNAAIQGKLVSQDPNDEPASKLLQRIRTEKERLIQAGKLKKEKPLPTIDPSEVPFVLPEGWEWVRLGDAFDVYVGSTPSRDKQDYWGGDINWVSSGEVAFCEILKTRETISETGLKNTSCSVHPPGTVMLGMIGEGKTRGQAAILRIHATHNQNTAAIRIERTGCIPEYLYWFLVFNYEATRKIGSGNNQKALNKERIRHFLFPFPPVSEQKRIVQEISVRLSASANVGRDLTILDNTTSLLRQSILKSAFEGNLV